MIGDASLKALSSGDMASSPSRACFSGDRFFKDVLLLPF
jgi:hypothetical protein